MMCELCFSTFCHYFVEVYIGNFASIIITQYVDTTDRNCTIAAAHMCWMDGWVCACVYVNEMCFSVFGNDFPSRLFDIHLQLLKFELPPVWTIENVYIFLAGFLLFGCSVLFCFYLLFHDVQVCSFTGSNKSAKTKMRIHWIACTYETIRVLYNKQIKW